MSDHWSITGNFIRDDAGKESRPVRVLNLTVWDD